MGKLLALHDKVKYNPYREDVVANSRHYKRYVTAFAELLDAFAEEVEIARATPAEKSSTGDKMLVELENRCFLIDARHRLSALYHLAKEYQETGDMDLEVRIRLLLARLEGTLGCIHEYIVSGQVRFFLRYTGIEDGERQKYVWRGTDYVQMD